MPKEWDAEEFRKHLQAHHTEYEPIFYSGQTYDEFREETIDAASEANWYASQHPECKTVGTLVEDAGFGDLSNKQWSEASQIYAEESSGTAHCFFGDDIRPDSDWVKYEREVAIKNPKINDDVKRFNLVPEQAGGVRSYTCDKHDLPSGSQQGEAVGTDKIAGTIPNGSGEGTTNNKGQEL